MKKRPLLILVCMISAQSVLAGVIPQPRVILPWGANEPWNMKYVVQDYQNYEAPAADTNGKSWTQLGYDDSSWQTLTGPMSSGDPNHQHRVTSFSVFTWEGENKVFNLRRTFNLSSVNEDGYTFVADFDDRIIVFINGKDVFDDGSYGFKSFHIDATDCQAGDNQLAIIYQAGPYYNVLDYALFEGTSYNAGNYDGLGFDGLHYGINSESETANVSGIDVGVTDPEILSSITFKNKTYPVTAIWQYAFSGSEMETITIPSSITTIGEEAFSGCNKLEEVYISDLSAWCNIDFGNEFANPLSAGGKLYLNNSRITNLVIPGNITKIKQYAFTGGLFANLTLPGQLTSIGKGAFMGCSTLRTATLPQSDGGGASFTTIGESAFQGCSALNSINFTNLPSVIGAGAFGGCSALTNVELGALTTINPFTFSGCTGLTTINIPSSVTSIGESAFQGCGKLSIDLVLPEGLTTIGNEAFAGCATIKTLSLPNTLTTIGDGALGGLSSIPSLYIPSSVTSIGEMAFIGLCNAHSIIVDEDNTKYDSRNNCNALIETKKGKLLVGCRNSFIPDGVKSLERAAFAHLPIRTAILPNSVETIKEGAFSWCPNLQTLVFGSGVTDITGAIHYSSGYYNSGPIDLYCYATTVPLADGDAWYWGYSNIPGAKLHVPAESIEAYQTTSPWNLFPSIVAITGEEQFPVDVFLDASLDNTDILESRDGCYANVTFVNHTIYRDGDWNTLCLPFNMTKSQINSAFAGADIRTLNGAAFNGGTLTLNFTPKVGDDPLRPVEGAISSITAGTPYIVKWDAGEPLTDIIINGVTIDKTVRDQTFNVGEGKSVTFKGTYNQLTYSQTDKSVLFLGTENTLYYPESDATIGAEHAYFKLVGLTTDDAALVRARIIFDDEDDNATGIKSVKNGPSEADGQWYTITGVRLDGKPTTKGLYIYNGNKVFVQ